MGLGNPARDRSAGPGEAPSEPSPAVAPRSAGSNLKFRRSRGPDHTGPNHPQTITISDVLRKTMVSYFSSAPDATSAVCGTARRSLLISLRAVLNESKSAI